MVSDDDTPIWWGQCLSRMDTGGNVGPGCFSQLWLMHHVMDTMAISMDMFIETDMVLVIAIVDMDTAMASDDDDISGSGVWQWVCGGSVCADTRLLCHTGHCDHSPLPRQLMQSCAGYRTFSTTHSIPR